MLRQAKVPGNITRDITSIRLAPGLKWNLNLVPRIDLTLLVGVFLMRAGTRVANKIVLGGGGGSSPAFNASFLLLFCLKY